MPLFGGRRAVLVKAGSAQHRRRGGSRDRRAVERMPRHHRGRRPAQERAVARAVREGQGRGGAALLRRRRARSGAADRRRDARRRILPSRRTRARRSTALLGGDRLASRSEIRKLALYARGKERIELADVLAVVSDASDLALDGVIDASLRRRHPRRRKRIRQGARRRRFAGGHRLGRHPPGRQPAQDAAGARRRRRARFRHAARRAAGAFHPQGSGRRGAARLDRRRACCAPCSSWRKPRSRRAATPRWPRQSRSARCCRSR